MLITVHKLQMSQELKITEEYSSVCQSTLNHIPEDNGSRCRSGFLTRVMWWAREGGTYNPV